MIVVNQGSSVIGWGTHKFVPLVPTEVDDAAFRGNKKLLEMLEKGIFTEQKSEPPTPSTRAKTPPPEATK